MTMDTTRHPNRTLPGPSGSLATPSRYSTGTSEWWIDRMTRALSSRLRRYERLEAYYRGTQDTQRLAGAAYRESGLLRMFPGLNANHARLIVNAAAQRLVVLGFRLQGELRADTEASRIWRMNEMESLSDVALTESLVKGECPILIEPNPRDPLTPILTPQRPEEMIVWRAKGDPRIRLAALKTWWDEDARRRLYTLYLPDRIEKWQDREPSQMDAWMTSLFATEPAAWELRGSQRQAVITNPLNEVPVVVLPNEPLLVGQPEGEHEAVLAQIDLYNKTLMDMAATSHSLAFPQRWGTGVEAEEEEPARDASGYPIAAAQSNIQARPDVMITTPAADAAFGEFAAAQLEGFVKFLDTIRADESTITFTPYHYLTNATTSVPPSGESLTAAEVPLVDKVKAHGRDKGSALRNAMRIAFLIAGDEVRARAMAGGSVIWSDPERRTESQHVDALGKMRTMLGVPQEAVWELIPAAPDTIERWQAMAAAEPAPPAPALPPGPPPDASANPAPSGSLGSAGA